MTSKTPYLNLKAAAPVLYHPRLDNPEKRAEAFEELCIALSCQKVNGKMVAVPLQTLIDEFTRIELLLAGGK